MKTFTPHIITEQGVQYQLGEMKSGRIEYSFNKILIYLEAKGKLMFGEKFKIYEEDKKTLYKLCVYFIQDHDNCKRFGIDPKKGILLSGPVGCGKTTLMRLLKYMVPHQLPYEVIPTRNITFAFNNIGYSTIEQFGNNKFFCFDDLGLEPIGKHFGKECNVMGEILLSRYDLFIRYASSIPNSSQNLLQPSKKTKTAIKTHGTTNLNAEELEERYGNRVRSRMRQMFNLISFDTKSIDKRV